MPTPRSGAVTPGPAGGTKIDRPPHDATNAQETMTVKDARQNIDSQRRFWHIFP
jgi:hypothetical protein